MIRNQPVLPLTPPAKVRSAQLLKALIAAILHICLTGIAASSDGEPLPDHDFRIPGETGALLDRYCYTCHDEETQKGDIRLDNLTELETAKRLDLLNRMQEQTLLPAHAAEEEEAAERGGAESDPGRDFHRTGRHTMPRPWRASCRSRSSETTSITRNCSPANTRICPGSPTTAAG